MLDTGPASTIFLGFCAKQVWPPAPGWGGAWTAHVREIASVSGCLSRRPRNWTERWDFNRSTCWDDETSALAAVPAKAASQFRLFCYRLVPILFSSSAEPLAVSIDDLFDDGLPYPPKPPDLSRYLSLGYDVVESPPSPILGFGCSPLSCNGMAKEIAVNAFCLIDDIGIALATAKRFGNEQPEPGPYVVVQVLKRSLP